MSATSRSTGPLRRVKRSDTFDAATDKAKAVVDLGVERAKDIVETTFSRDAGQRRPNRSARRPAALAPDWLGRTWRAKSRHGATATARTDRTVTPASGPTRAGRRGHSSSR